ncbi:MAG: hypothetical protein JWR69_13 [Pedosphaera sp.]|nr:hypothetical protein [Pedosphaera sp.]
MNILLFAIVGLIFAMLAWGLIRSLPSATLTARFTRHKGFQRHWRKVAKLPTGLKRLASFWPGRNAQVEFANVAEGTHTNGQITRLTDAALATRFFVVKIGSDADHVAVSAANTDIPLGICTDEAPAAEELVSIALLGAAPGTLKAVAGAAIAAGAFIQSNGDGTVITLKATSGTWYIIGRAITAAAAANDVIEFDPCLPIQRVVP